MSETSAQPLIETLRVADRDRYLATLYAPADRRDALAALYAFNAEIAGVRDRVSQALPGEIRLQWWRDVIASGQGGAGHPLAEKLQQAIDRYGLPRAAFENYLEARIFDLYDDPMPSRTDLEGYCGETASALIQLSFLVLDAEQAAAHAELAGHAGCAQAITGLLRLLPLHRARGQCYVPRDMLAAVGTTPEEFLAPDGNEAAKRAVAVMIALAREHLAAFETAAEKLPASLRPAVLPLALAKARLDKMDAHKADVLAGGAEIASWRKHWLLYRRASRGWG